MLQLCQKFATAVSQHQYLRTRAIQGVNVLLKSQVQCPAVPEFLCDLKQVT